MDPPLPVTLKDGYEAGGCLAGTRYCRVTPQGDLTACPYMEASVGSIREQDFAALWQDAPPADRDEDLVQMPAVIGRRPAIP